jgi:activator of HSP90 ATPase
MIKKENFTHAYAATSEEPTHKEIEYVLSILPEIETRECHFVLEHYNCNISCGCDKKEDSDSGVLGFNIEIPEEISDSEDDRILSILQCTNCGKWALCD